MRGIVVQLSLLHLVHAGGVLEPHFWGGVRGIVVGQDTSFQGKDYLYGIVQVESICSGSVWAGIMLENEMYFSFWSYRYFWEIEWFPGGAH